MSHSSLVSCLAGIRSKQPWLVMNAAEKFSLSRSDNPIISHFYSFDAVGEEKETFAIPDGCVDILFDCDSSHPKVEVFGTTMEAMDIELMSHHRYFGVRFISGIVPDCLNISAQELVEHHYDFLEVLPQANQVFEDIVTSSSFTEQAALFGAFFDNKENRQPSALTAQVLRIICEKNGCIRVNDLESLTGYTTRTIQRQFRADMGMSPKAFSQIMRCQSAVYDINHGDNIAFSDMACDLGFSDQSHFLREFKKLVKTTPLDYMKRVKNESYLGRILHM